MIYDGTNETIYTSWTGPQTIDDMSLHIGSSNGLQLRIYNLSGSAANYAWTGMQTK